MERIVKMPRMGMNVDEGTIVEWHVKEGQSFSIARSTMARPWKT